MASVELEWLWTNTTDDRCTNQCGGNGMTQNLKPRQVY